MESAFFLQIRLVLQVMYFCLKLDLLAYVEYFMQKKSADFSRQPGFLESFLDELESLKWCADSKALIASLEQEVFYGKEYR